MLDGPVFASTGQLRSRTDLPEVAPDPGAGHALSLSPYQRAQSRLVAWMTLASVACALAVSPQLLSLLGIPYDAPTGSFVFKLHPSTYLLFAAFALALAERGNPLAELGRSLAHQPAVAIYLLLDGAMIAYSVARHGFSGAAFFIESQFAAGVLALLLARLDLATLRRLFALIATILVANALLGIGEQLVKQRLIPLTVFGGKVLVEDVFRATALMGHPLVNASVTGFALFAFYGLRDARARLAGCFILLVALLSFGGRVSFVLNTALLVPLVILDGAGALRRGRLSFRALTGGAVLGIVLLAALVVAVIVGGVGQRIIEKMTWDHSASVREVSLTVYRFMYPDQILLGVSPKEIEHLMHRVGIDFPKETIENFWVVLSLQVGALFCALFTAGFAVFVWRLVRISGTPVRLALLAFVLTASTTNSLASKSALLSIVVAIAYAAAAQRAGTLNPAPAGHGSGDPRPWRQ